MKSNKLFFLALVALLTSCKTFPSDDAPSHFSLAMTGFFLLLWGILSSRILSMIMSVFTNQDHNQFDSQSNWENGIMINESTFWGGLVMFVLQWILGLIPAISFLANVGISLVVGLIGGIIINKLIVKHSLSVFESLKRKKAIRSSMTSYEFINNSYMKYVSLAGGVLAGIGLLLVVIAIAQG